MPSSQITPCLWFDGNAEEAANFYTSFFKGGKITELQRYGNAGTEVHGRQAGSVKLVFFELNGQSFTALNGGPLFKFSQAISFHIDCADQAEVDYYWEKLSDGADPASQRCGWVADKFGVCWQIFPSALKDMLSDPDPEKERRTFDALMKMTKIDIAALKRAYEG